MVCNWGMSEKIGPQSFGKNQELMFLGREINKTQTYSEDTAQKIDKEISKLLRDCYQRATDIITEHRDKLNMIAEHLLIEETIDGRDVEEIIEHGRILSEEEREAVDNKNKPAEEKKEPDNTDITENNAEKSVGNESDVEVKKDAEDA
jgi:cell division protease FtsH